MPIYLVRWPDLRASLVRAANKDDLFEILDQEGNPEDCEWSVYKGPLFIDINLPVECSIRDDRPGQPVSPGQVVVGDLSKMLGIHILDSFALSFSGDNGYEAATEILRKAFPQIHDALEESFKTEEGAAREGALPEDKLRTVLESELARLLGWSWRQAQLSKKTDPVSALARELDMPADMLRSYAEKTIEDSESDDGDPEPTKGR